MLNESRWLLITRGLWLGILLMVAIVSLARSQRMAFDFHHFYLDGAYIWQHWEFNPIFDAAEPDENRQLPFYLPVIPLALAIVCAGGPLIAGLLFALVHVGSLAATMLTMQGAFKRIYADSLAGPLLVTGLLMVMSIYEAARYNQMSFVMLALVVAGCASLRQKPLAAGVLLGLAATIKLLPGIFGVWLLLKRRWSAAAAMVATVVLVSILPVAVAFGPQKCVELHLEWFSYNFGSVSGHGMSGQGFDDHFVDHHNQSIAETLARTFRADHPAKNYWQPVNLSADIVKGLSLAVAGGLLLGLVYLTRRPIKQLDERHVWFEFAAFCLAMLIFSPLLRQYYFVWVLPAVLLFAAEGMTRVGRHRFGQIGIALWLLGNLAWPSVLMREYGWHLLTFAAMAAMLLLYKNEAGSSHLEELPEDS